MVQNKEMARGERTMLKIEQRKSDTAVKFPRLRVIYKDATRTVLDVCIIGELGKTLL